MLRSVMWLAGPQAVELTVAAAQGPLETFNDITKGAASIATAAAVVIGGLWAYFKFVRGRTFKPKLSIDMAGQWRSVTGVGNVFHVRIKVTNIGASKANLRHSGTGLIVSFPAQNQFDLPGSIDPMISCSNWTQFPESPCWSCG
jgi:hypothetical protein